MSQSKPNALSRIDRDEFGKTVADALNGTLLSDLTSAQRERLSDLASIAVAVAVDCKNTPPKGKLGLQRLKEKFGAEIDRLNRGVAECRLRLVFGVDDSPAGFFADERLVYGDPGHNSEMAVMYFIHSMVREGGIERLRRCRYDKCKQWFFADKRRTKEFHSEKCSQSVYQSKDETKKKRAEYYRNRIERELRGVGNKTKPTKKRAMA